MPDTSTLTLPVLPLRNGVVVPNMVVTVSVETEEAQRAIAAAETTGGRLLLVPRVEDEYASTGTIAEIQKTMTDGRSAVLIAGIARATIGAGSLRDHDVMWVDVDRVSEPDTYPGHVFDLASEYKAVVAEILEHRGIGVIADRILGIDDPGQLADLAVYSPDLSLAQKVELLETIDVEERLILVLEWMNETLADLTIRQRVRDEATERIEKGQREFVLRQQLETIREELGEGSGDAVSEYRSKLADADLPEKAREAVEREIDRLERMNEQSPEHGWIRTWLDTVFEIPWNVTTQDQLDLQAARAVLDADHTGLDDVKDRIIEHLAVNKLRTERGIGTGSAASRGDGSIVLLVGPPGVGKTSLGESVAKALDRKFVRVALGGVRDEAEIRGHRRTYVGARPGRIARAVIDAGSMNPVFLLDEMDKVGADWRGDPSSALLEVLDPAQNHTFRDHYLELDLDMSDVMFIATANVIDSIPAPLLDRTEVIRLDGYTDVEKVEIARDHLLVRKVEQTGLESDELVISDETLGHIVDGYTREAGVRGLERQLGKLVRKVVTRIALDSAITPVVVEPDDLRDILGRPTVHHDEAKDRTERPGVATGLAVTGAGGDVLFIEATAMAGEPGMTITGQLGDVMKESAQIALSYVRANAQVLGIEASDLDRRFHLHVPAGAVPKDGPSAGIAMTTALVSLLSGRTVRGDVAMTGEVTLQGRVLPIGGVKQKVLAAHRAGLREVILPERNSDDLDDVPDQVRDEMTFHTFADVSQVIDRSLEPIHSP